MSDSVVLVLNAGSSSIKFQLFSGDEPLLRGLIDGLGTAARFTARTSNNLILIDRDLTTAEGAGHGPALRPLMAFLLEHFPDLDLAGVGHRVVHGGPTLSEPVVVTPEVETVIESLVSLAPLHQPHNLAGIRAARTAFPGIPQVACFDTAFHRDHPWVNDAFALPRRYFDEGVRRYGFHGLSYEFIAQRLGEIAPDVASGRVVVAHLGNGASMCAIKGGRSVISTMGFSALDGLPMGTRCGQLDPGVILYLLQEKGMTAGEISELLYRESGLKGLSGLTGDMRELEASRDRRAADAIDYFVFRIRREIGAMAAVLSGLDAIVFTGGIGENSGLVRRRVIAGLEWLGIILDEAANAQGLTEISSRTSRVKVLVVQTDEECMIARHTRHVISRLGAA